MTVDYKYEPLLSLAQIFTFAALNFRASPEVRAEVSELVNQLESANPNLSPTQNPELLDGNWVLL